MRWWLERIVGALLVALSLVSVAVMYRATAEMHSVTECQARYNEAFAAVNAERAEAARQDRAAIRNFLTSLGQSGATSAQRAQAYRAYLDALDAADARRDANPLPTEHCGG